MGSNKPTETLRDGQLKATIWEQQGEKGTFYRVTLLRSYTDDQGKWQETNSFTGSDLLKISRLAERAYDRTLALRAKD